LAESDPGPPFGTQATIVGFGQTGGAVRNYGIKRSGRVSTDDCTGIDERLGNTELVCWTFDGPIGPAGEDSNTCNGDSGGPLLVGAGSSQRVVGVTSGGLSPSCSPTDRSYDAKLAPYADFIAATLDGDRTEDCGVLATVGEPSVKTIELAGSLSPDHGSDTYAIAIDGPARLAVFALNGAETFGLDADLYVKAGAGVSEADFDCAAAGRSSYGACRIVAPSVGLWSVRIARVLGSGEYQLTVTLHGGEPPECGNGVLEIGEECDGDDDSACLGSCDGGACHCDPACLGGPLERLRLRGDDKRFRLSAVLDDANGSFSGSDPRAGFELEIEQGASSVSLRLDAGDRGWAKSRPKTGRFVWRGSSRGFRRVRLLDRSATTLGGWKLSVRGRRVSGAADLDGRAAFDARVAIDGTCSSRTYAAGS
jgi:hypothetical protein